MTDNLAYIDMTLFARAMISYLRTAYRKQGITVSIRGEELRLDVNIAIPCALIISELLVNALQYAFGGEEKGEVEISFAQREKEVLFTVSDSGKGLPEGMDFDSPDTLGLQLTRELAGQLDGRVEKMEAKGTSIRVRFPHISL
jgi:two-component sensor histidine kinase